MFVCAACGQSYDRGGFCAEDGLPLPETTDPLLGTEVGRFRLARQIGEGGMGQVYLGVQPAIGSRVAVKILSDQCARNPELLQRFFAEAKAVNVIKHENIVSVLDLAQLPDGRPYIVMEFIEGQTLGAIVRAGLPPIGGVVQAMREVLSALGAAHQLGIVHRDLKPDNILITGEGHAKVLDFGIAKLAPSLSNALSPRTQTGALLGTPAYMAPEQISGAANVDPRTDLYAAGIVLFEAVTGRVPFKGDTVYDLMRAHLEDVPPAPRTLRPDLPPAFEQVILHALAKDPKDRFQTASAMTQAIESAAQALAPEQWRALSSRGGVIAGRPSLERMLQPTPVDLARAPTRVATPIPMERTAAGPRSRTPLIAIGAAVLVAGGLVMIIASRRTSDTPAPAPIAQETPPPAPIAQEAPPPAPIAQETPPPSSPRSAPPAAPSRSAAPAGGPSAVAAPPAKAPPAIAPPVVVKPPATVATEGDVKFLEAPAIGNLALPADYNAKRFDPVAYLPKATALAQRLLPDAKLTTFEFDPVYPDGHVDLTFDGRDRQYEFRSPARSGLPAGHPKNVPLERACRVMVEVTPREVTARVVTSDSCNAVLVKLPRCSFAQVWAKARAKGIPDDLVARIGWLFDSAWFFDTSLGGSGGISTFVDDC